MIDRQSRGHLVGLDSLVATSAYQPEPQAVAAARHFVRQTLQSWQGSGYCPAQDGMVDDAVLLTSELVTNAVVHAQTWVQVTCRVAGEAVEIAVVDHRPVQLIPDAPQETALSAESTNGRGLQLPSELASSWGVTYARTSKSVWFRMGLGAGESEMGARHGALGLPAAASSRGGEPPARARRNLARVGYEELLRSIVQTARAASGADAAYLMVAGDDGEIRVRATSGVRLPPAAAGLLPAGVATALSLITVPLLAGGRVTGILVIAGTEPDRFRERDADRLQRLADTSAPALERARLDELGRGRRDRVRFLAEAGDLLAVSLDRERILALGAQLVIANLAAWCAVLLADDEAAPRLAHAAHANCSRTAALDWLLRRIAASARQAPGHRQEDHRPGWRWQLAGPAGSETGPPGVTELLADQAWCFPLVTAHRELGLLVIGGPGTGRLPAEVAELAEGLASRVALALAHCRDGYVGGSGLARGDIPLPARDMSASILRSG